MSRIELAFRYAFGSRIHEYRRILTAALDAGYTVCSVEQSLRELQCGTEKILVLRHDVDDVSPGVRAMAGVEAELNVTSTYYFRLCTFEEHDVAYVKRLGHEVSLHYETIADYAQENGINSAEPLQSDAHLEKCAQRLERDLAAFRALSGCPCRTLASHGAPLNRLLQLPNRFLFEALPDLAARLEIDLEAYDRSYLSQFDLYISDTQWGINDGFRYGVHPLDAIARSIPRIILLTHPNHWSFTLRTRLRRVVRSLLFGKRVDPSVFAEADRLRGS